MAIYEPSMLLTPLIPVGPARALFLTKFRMTLMNIVRACLSAATERPDDARHVAVDVLASCSVFVGKR